MYMRYHVTTIEYFSGIYCQTQWMPVKMNGIQGPVAPAVLTIAEPIVLLVSRCGYLLYSVEVLVCALGEPSWQLAPTIMWLALQVAQWASEVRTDCSTHDAQPAPTSDVSQL